MATHNGIPRFSWLHLAAWVCGSVIVAVGFYGIAVAGRDVPQQWMAFTVVGAFGAACGLFCYRTRLINRIRVAEAREIQSRIGGDPALPIPRFSWVHFTACVVGYTIVNVAMNVAMRHGLFASDPDFVEVVRARQIWPMAVLGGVVIGGLGYFLWKRNQTWEIVDRAATGTRDPAGHSTTARMLDEFSHTHLVAYAVGYPVLVVGGIWFVSDALGLEYTSQYLWKFLLTINVVQGLSSYLGSLRSRACLARERQRFESIDWTPLP